jgi:hypothetical protein
MVPCVRGSKDKAFAMKPMGKYFRTDDRDVLEETYEAVIKSVFNFPPYPVGVPAYYMRSKNNIPKRRTQSRRFYRREGGKGVGSLYYFRFGRPLIYAARIASSRLVYCRRIVLSLGAGPRCCALGMFTSSSRSPSLPRISSTKSSSPK